MNENLSPPAVVDAIRRDAQFGRLYHRVRAVFTGLQKRSFLTPLSLIII
jgi:hypothetical protein